MLSILADEISDDVSFDDRRLKFNASGSVGLLDSTTRYT